MTVPPWAVSVIVVILLAVVAYMVKGLLSFGKMSGNIESKFLDLSANAVEMKSAIGEIKRDMLRPADLQAAILKMQLESYKEMMGDAQGNTPRRRKRAR